MTVLVFLRLDAHLSGGLHLELVHSGAGFGNVDLVALGRLVVSLFHLLNVTTSRLRTDELAAPSVM